MKTFFNDGKIISISTVNDIFMVCEMVYLTTETNLNRVKFTEEFIDYVIEHKNDYVCIPLVVDIKSLLERDFDNLTHLFKNNKFGTTSIGSFYDFYKVTNGDIVELRATIRIPKRNEEVCGLLAELHTSDDGLKFSYEMAINSYTIDEDGVCIVDAGGGSPIGSCVVSIPAVPAAKCQTLVAELIGLEGEKMNEIVNFTAKTNVYIAELTREQIETKIRNAFRKLDRQSGYNLYISDVFDGFLVAFNCETGDYVKYTYELVDGEIKLSDDGVVVERSYVETAIAEVTGTKTAEAIIAEKDAALEQARADLITVGEQLASANDKIVTLEGIKSKYDTIIAERETAEKDEAKKKLEAKCKKVMTDAEIAEVKDLIENLDEASINAKIAEKYVAVAEKMKETAPASIITDSFVIAEKKNKYITM